MKSTNESEASCDFRSASVSDGLPAAASEFQRAQYADGRVAMVARGNPGRRPLESASPWVAVISGCGATLSSGEMSIDAFFLRRGFSDRECTVTSARFHDDDVVGLVLMAFLVIQEVVSLEKGVRRGVEADSVR